MNTANVGNDKKYSADQTVAGRAIGNGCLPQVAADLPVPRILRNVDKHPWMPGTDSGKIRGESTQVTLDQNPFSFAIILNSGRTRSNAVTMDAQNAGKHRCVVGIKRGNSPNETSYIVALFCVNNLKTKTNKKGTI